MSKLLEYENVQKEEIIPIIIIFQLLIDIFQNMPKYSH